MCLPLELAFRPRRDLQAIGLRVTLGQPYLKDTTVYWKDWPLQLHGCVSLSHTNALSRHLFAAVTLKEHQTNCTADPS